MSMRRGYGACAAINKKIYVATGDSESDSGGGGDNNAASRSGEVYDLDTELWSPIPNIGTAVGCAGSTLGAAAAGKFYVVGGFPFFNAAGSARATPPPYSYNTIQIFDPGVEPIAPMDVSMKLIWVRRLGRKNLCGRSGIS